MHGAPMTPDGEKATTMMPDQSDTRRRTLLFVASLEAVPETLALALQSEFPWIVVEHVETIKAAFRPFTRPVALILLESLMLGEAEAAAAELARHHPHAHTAIIEADGQRPFSAMADVLRSKLVRSVLPMNLKLDVWLSVVRLMLRGGEYLPAGMMYRNGRDMPDELAREVRKVTTELTHRELQVLELVSRGLQNKSIAAQLDLSEHTVKIHLHNIISKLRAHNRTEAAAWFRDYQVRHLAAAAWKRN